MDGDCSHEIKKHLLLGRKSMTNLDSVFKSRDITLLTQVRLVKAMVFPVVMYECESWTIKEAEHQRIDAFKLWYWKRLLRAPIVHATPPCSPSVLQTCVSSLHPTDLDPLTQSCQLCSLSLEFSIFPLLPSSPHRHMYGSLSLSFQVSAQIPPSQKASLCPSFKKSTVLSTAHHCLHILFHLIVIVTV